MSLDQIGPLAKTVSDTETLFNTIRGEDPLDSTTLSLNVRTSDVCILIKERKKIKIGVPMHFMQKGIDEDVMNVFENALQKCETLGFDIQKIELPNIAYSLPAYYIIMPAEVSTNLARYDGTRYGLHKDGGSMWADLSASRAAGFGGEVRRRILLGAYVLSAGYYDSFYTKANSLRRVIAADFETVFKDVDLIMTPTTPSPAFPIGEKTADPLQMYLEDIFTVPANIAGIPALSIPAGTVTRDGAKLPVGVQLMSDYKQEDVLFFVGKKFLGEPI
jgi:aspartyl-tRNA(Asn)/glutamyl-tRNA(Gln) amidotransferase subunit A